MVNSLSSDELKVLGEYGGYSLNGKILERRVTKKGISGYLDMQQRTDWHINIRK